MFKDFIKNLKADTKKWEKVLSYFEECEIPAKTLLLREGELSSHLHFIKKGCLRLSYNHEGKDISLQFFFEGQAVSSLDSFLSDVPSDFSIESLEPCIIQSLHKKDFEQLIKEHPEIKDAILEQVLLRFRSYIKLFLSQIRDTPQKRYEELIKHSPQVFQRVPQHYIASYLGITSVSLSRIRNRK